MAILEELPGITVTIEVDDAPLIEHPTSNDAIKHDDPLVRAHQSGCTTTNYIECITGKAFYVKAFINSTFKWDCPRLSFVIFVDGEYVDARLPARKDYENKDSYFSYHGPISGVPGKSGALRRFKFTAIKITQDTADATKIQKDKDQMSKVGEIIVKVYRQSEGIMEGCTLKKSNCPFNKLDNDINEKSLKGEAKYHGTSLGAAETTIMPLMVRSDRLDGDDYPIAIYKFKYRSNEALKHLGIIDRTPESDDDNIFEGLTAEERREVKNFARKVKTERDDGVPIKKEGKKSKRKRNARKQPTSSASPDIIDLTED